ncbi:MAG: hypothetical protein LBK95_19655 [Bifidobacteriaceae bacterium]|nr:hypothetical protein [Bifidobacteriaceae bacterium]
MNTVKSRATIGLALLLAGSLLGVFVASDNSSHAATPTDYSDSAAGAASTPTDDTLTVNVQEVPASDDGTSGLFDLSAYGDLDWFHLTGVPCSNPYFDPVDLEDDGSGAAPFAYCATPGQGDGWVGRTGGQLAVAKLGGSALTWAPLYHGDSSDAATAYQGVYEGTTSPVTYNWDDSAATISDPTTAPGWWNDSDDGNEYVHVDPKPGDHLEGVFYDPDSKGMAATGQLSDAYGPAGYTITVAPDQADQDRVLRFIGGAWQAEATVTITAATGGSAEPAASSVPLDPSTLDAGTDQINSLYTIYIPAGHGATITVRIDSVNEETGHVSLGGAALSGPGNPDHVAFTAGLPMPGAAGAGGDPGSLNAADPAKLDPAVPSLSSGAETQRAGGALMRALVGGIGPQANDCAYDMPCFTKKAFDCTGVTVSITPNVLETQCAAIGSSQGVASGTTVYWLFTLENRSESPLDSIEKTQKFTVTDESSTGGNHSCTLSWTRDWNESSWTGREISGEIPAGLSAACILSEVLW